MSRNSTIRRFSIGLLLAIPLVMGGTRGWGEEVEPARSEVTAPTVPQVNVMANQRFSNESGRAGLCDVYTPAGSPPRSGHPVVIVVHGGGWISGDKWTLEGYSRLFARHGFVVVTINYRLAPAHKFPAQVDDVRQAMLWVKENADRLTIDLNRLGMFGYSAGGHLSALVASLADERIEARVAASQWSPTDARWKKLPTIHAVCAGGPPCDFRSLPIDNTSLAYFLGGSRREIPDTYTAASPAAHVSPADPVTQIIHGESDLIVPLLSSRQYHKAQVSAGIDSRLEVMPNQGHMVTFLNPQTSTKALEFFREVLLDPAATP